MAKRSQVEILDAFKEAVAEVRKLHKAADDQAYAIFRLAVTEVAAVYEAADAKSWQLFKDTLDQAREVLAETKPSERRKTVDGCQRYSIGKGGTKHGRQGD